MTDIRLVTCRDRQRELPELTVRRHRPAKHHVGLLADTLDILLPVEPGWARSDRRSFCVSLPEGADQKTVMQKTFDAGVEAHRGITCSYGEPAYRQEPWSCGARCPLDSPCPRLVESEKRLDPSAVPPRYHGMTDDERTHIAAILSSVVRDGP
jgi:dTDP-4-amino-4,6-dideoxygalactose transaminase